MRIREAKKMMHLATGCVALAAITAWAVMNDLPTETTSLFAGSGTCDSCHKSNGTALVDSQGRDLGLTTRWRSTMMANASKEPFWQAKVESEVAAFPALKEIIEDKCTTCHAPMARTQVVFDGASGYGMDAMRQDALALDGVSCTLCHQIQPDNLGTPESFSGEYLINDSRVLFGPYGQTMDGPMQAVVNYSAELGDHMHEAALCAVCHTLYTPYLDDAGEIAGTFPEQVPFLEWQNSIYSDDGTPCQDCHMPRLDEDIQITTIPPSAPGRQPFWQHHFVGGNSLMLGLMKDHIEDLGLTATEEQFDSTLALTRLQLREKTAVMDVEYEVSDGLLELEVDILNRTGHKFPTGFPSRRAWLHVRVATQSGEKVFESGRPDGEGRILENELRIEPHHDVITDDSEVQIYESRMVDVNGDPTSTLLRGAGYAKDNRIPPVGFTSNVDGYDDMAIRGVAVDDPDFNNDSGQQGTGADEVTYSIDLEGAGGVMDVLVELLYQTVTPEWIDDLSTYDTPAVASFVDLYGSADKTPAVVQSWSGQIDVGSGTGVEDALPDDLGIALGDPYPNPFGDKVSIPLDVPDGRGSVRLEIYSVSGELVRELETGPVSRGEMVIAWDGLDSTGRVLGSGAYLVLVVSPDARQEAKVVFALR